MSTFKKNIGFDLKKNFQEKNYIIDDLKELLHSEISNTDKIKKFKKIREKWVSIGKVQSHLSFGVNNSYKHHIKLFYDYLYLDKKIKEKDQEDNKKMKLSIIEDAVRVKSYGDKLKSYRELLVLIKKWNYLTGPTKGNEEKKLNNKFDSIIQEVKNNKKDYLKNRDDHDKKNIEIKKELVENFKKLMIEEIDEKSKWIKKIKQIEKIKDEFIGMGPIKSSQNNELWREFKSANKEFINKKNLFFKNLKKTYSDNIKKQINLIEEIKKLKDSKKINISVLQKLKSKFKNIKNVPFKRNKENWNLFLDIYNSCFNQIDELKNEKSQKDKEILDKKNNLIEDLKNDFSLEKINTITEEWAKIDNKNSLKELTGLISLVTQQLKLKGLTKNEIEANILKIKSKLIDDSEKRSEKIRLRKKIEDLTKQISQLENNLNFIKTGSDNKVLDGVYNDIEKLKNQLNKNEKKYILIK
jgi:hypothetical protein